MRGDMQTLMMMILLLLLEPNLAKSPCVRQGVAAAGLRAQRDETHGLYMEEHRALWGAAGLDRQLACVCDNVLPDEILAAALSEARMFDALGTCESFWCALRGAESGEPVGPRFAIEAAVHTLFAHDFGGRETDIAGGEWWVQERALSEDIDFHFDKDEGLLAASDTYSFPPVSTVTYLTSSGAPTLILNHTLPAAGVSLGSRATPVVPSNGFLSYPKTNRHLRFRGTLQHGVPSQLLPMPSANVHPMEGPGGVRMLYLIIVI